MLTEQGHLPNRSYVDQDGTFHKNGAAFHQDSGQYVAGGSALTLDQSYDGKTIFLDTAAGTTITLPAASGSGMKFRFIITVVATSNSHVIKVANANDAMQGIIASRDDSSDNCVAFSAVAGTDDTITLNRSTTGSVVKGESIEVEDIAANVWQVSGLIANTGAQATPFSATV